MTNIFYTIVIFPLVQIIELCYLFVFRIFHDPAIALLGVSAAVSIITLPLYFRAEVWQSKEREIQKRLKTKIDKIKAVFKGDERYMVLSACYRQNRYHPVYALRSSFGILIQVPFFIAAYSCLSHLETLQGSSFLFIKDLGKADALVSITTGGHAIVLNILPVFMTLINILSGIVYTKGMETKSKIQLYGMALVFLALLYNSPSGLVLYWTMNNIFSLAKNILQKIKHAKRIIYTVLCISALLFDLYVLCFHDGYLVKRLVVFFCVSIVFLLPFLKYFIIHIKNKIRLVPLAHTAVFQTKTFLFSILVLFLLFGAVIPASLITTSTAEFSFVEDITSPFVFIGTVMLQSAGIFIFWPCCIYFLFSKITKMLLTAVFMFCCTAALINAFLFQFNYGFLTNTLILSNPDASISNLKMVFLNCAILLLLIPAELFLLVSPRARTPIFSIQIIILTALIGFGILSTFTINRDYRVLAEERSKGLSFSRLSPVYSLSKTGRNVVILMLDRAISGFVPHIFEEKPELSEQWSGFTWYPNCVSFSGWTLFGVPALAGGYDYTPLSMQQNPKPLVEKHNESLLLLPRIFEQSGYGVTVTDPSWANYGWSPNVHIFDPYPAINAENIASAYTDYWLNGHDDIHIVSLAELLTERLIRFSFFKSMPAILRRFIYDRGDWLTINNRDQKESRHELTLNMLGKYAALDYLPDITSFDAKPEGNLLMIYNELTHDPAFLQAPEYVPAASVTNKGTGPFADEAHYHVCMAAFRLLGKWFSYLKENNVYDNTRIIIVSDHGFGGIKAQKNYFTLPNNDSLEKYIALLMVKDFNAGWRGVQTNDVFMTQADVPLLALEGLVNNPVNPFTGLPLQNKKTDGVFITASNKFYPIKHGKYTFNIAQDEWFQVHDNIFNATNWSRVKIPE
jgi:YidC/Oxa1 family membrane protein insertase